MTVLRKHVHDMHPHVRMCRSNADLATAHARDHYRLGNINHYHKGPNLGPDQRPDGWYTGEDAVLKQR